jgi:myosin heavy subunit
LDLPSSKRMRRDPTFGRATPVRNHEIQQFVHATPFPLREEISALFSPEELLLSPLPIDQKFDPIRTSVNTLDFSSTRTLESTKAAVEERSDVVQMCKAHPRVHPMKPTSEECTSACAGSTSRDDSARTFPALAPSENWVFESIDHSTLHDVSATLLARAFKAYEVRSCYKQWRKSVIRLQALYRGSAARSRIRGDEAIRRLTSAVIVIQAAWRSSCAQKCVARVIRAVLLLQSASRVFIARRRLQKSKVNAASTCVQSAWRRHLARVGYNCKLRSLCVLQSLARKFLARVEYLRLRSAERKRLAALKIQRTWRGTSSRREYILKQRSTQLIQSAFRGISTRRAITSRRRRSASTCVQAAWRRHVCRQKLAVSRRAMIFIQTFVRTGLAKSEFERLHQVRKNDTSALIIQRAWRCISERRSYIDCLGAAMLIQSAYRGFVARQRIMAHRNNYAARYIQACWRCNVNHVKFTSTRQRIILVQSFTRKKQAISKLVQLRTARERNLAALMVQKSWRCSNARRNFTVCLRKAILIQSAYRGVLVRQARKAHRKNVACTLVQVAWKCYMYRKIYKASRLAAILLQSHVRTQQARMRHECLILARKQEDSASTIQVLWRGSYARRTFVEHLCKAMLIQSVFRGFLVRKELNSSRNNTACTVLQETWRLYMARKKYADLRRATILVQTMARSRLANSRLERLKLARERKLELAALDIQRLIRGSFTRRSLKVARELDRAASTIQRFWRLNSARKSYDRSAVLLQSAFRSFRARKLRNKMVLVITACIIIQAAWRGHNSRSQYQQVTFAAVRVQALIRGVFARAELNLPRSTKEAPDNAALIIQAMWRSWSIRGTFLATLSAAKVIQSTIRRRLALNICSRLRERNAKRAACLRIQSTWNGYIHRRKYSMAVRSLVVIQATARMHIAKSHLRNLRSARLLLLSKLILLQSLWRRFAARRHYFHASNNRRALVIQTKWRAWSSRNRFCRMKASSVTIQTTARRHLAQRHSSTLLVAITKLQACLRGSAQRLSFQRKLRAVVLLQAIGRGFATRVASRMRRSNIAATAIQSLFRGSIARQQVTERCHAAVVLQTCWRGYSTYRHYLKVLRAFMTLKEAETLSPADRPHKMDQADVPLPIFDTPGRRPNRGSSAAKQAPEDVVSTRKPLGDLGLTPRTSASSQTNARATRSREQLKLETGAMKVNRCTSREEVQKLKVVELRDVLRQRGVESKLYRNLRKAELIQLVLEDDD